MSNSARTACFFLLMTRRRADIEFIRDYAYFILVMEIVSCYVYNLSTIIINNRCISTDRITHLFLFLFCYERDVFNVGVLNPFLLSKIKFNRISEQVGYMQLIVIIK